MKLAIEKTIATGADMCVATDPDCDRIGAGVRQGDTVTLISGNDMGVLLLDYVCSTARRRRANAAVAVKTIVTTEMAVPICKKYGVELRNVLTGFKFIGEQIGLLEKEGHTERYIFGFEESYGYLSGTSVRDKDAVNAAVLVCEMAANYKAQGLTLLDKLEQLLRGVRLLRPAPADFPVRGRIRRGEDGGHHAQAPAPRWIPFRMRISRPRPASTTRTMKRVCPKSDVLSFCAAGWQQDYRPPLWHGAEAESLPLRARRKSGSRRKGAG